jgi:hypothetical protein
LPEEEIEPMARPRVIQELSGYLAALLRSGLRSGASAEGLFPVYWGHPREFDEHAELAAVSPLVGLCLLEVLPELGARSARAMIERGEAFSERSSLAASLHAPPFWLTCRFLLSIRSDEPVEEQELAAACFRLLLENPVVPRSALESLRHDGALSGAGDGLSLEVRREPGLWRDLGLRRHRLLIPFDVTVPLPATAELAAARVTERRVRLEVDAAGEGGER